MPPSDYNDDYDHSSSYSRGYYCYDDYCYDDDEHKLLSTHYNPLQTAD